MDNQALTDDDVPLNLEQQPYTTVANDLPTSTVVTSTTITRASLTRTRRKLNRDHFAFMRAYVQGLDLRENWTRYLLIEGEHTDMRLVRKTVAWLRDEFAAAAVRHKRPGLARLVRLDASKIVDTNVTVPSLQEFVDASNLQDFSEEEQIAYYQDVYGTVTKATSRRGRLIAKQIAELIWLEQQVASPPRAGDVVDDWLHPDLASKMRDAGIFTLRQLVTLVNGRGQHWWKPIKAVGATKAERIFTWLTSHADSIGIPIGDHVLKKRSALSREDLDVVVQPDTDVRPIEKFIVPSSLDGTQGTYRLPQERCLMGAKNDYEALLTWVQSKQTVTPEKRLQLLRKRGIDPMVPAPFDWLHCLSNTQRAYLKEGERFMLWAIIERKKPLSSMTMEDCIAYRNFLADPQPRDRWCGPRGHERWSPLWRPFEGKLSPSAQRRAISALKGFYKFLVSQNYLLGNPWEAIATPKQDRTKINIGRSFTKNQWNYIEQQLASLPDNSASRRLRFALHLLYTSGLRLDELVNAHVCDLSSIEYPGDDEQEPLAGWLLHVVGKGGVERDVPLPDFIVDELKDYLVSRGLPADLHSPLTQSAPLLGLATDIADRAPWSPYAQEKIDPLQAVSRSTFHDQLKAFFKRCADNIDSADSVSAARFRNASAHWLRHTHASHAVVAGTLVKVLQSRLGHADLSTTTIYTTTEKRLEMEEIQKFWKTLKK